MNAEGIKDYANELDVLQVTDDVQGNGLFDPPGSHGNVHSDAGIFQDHLSLPGYIARDRMYAPSEVQDAITGEPVMYVPGGAVSIDAAQRRAYEDRLLWEIPPGVSPWEPNPVPEQSTVRPRGAAWPVSGTEQAPQQASMGKMFAMTAAAGLGLGMFAALVWPKKK